MLSPEERENYQAVYCGVCHTTGKHYGQFSRLFLNYDFAFLAMLLAPEDTPCSNACKGCFVHPLKGRPSCGEGAWLEKAAGESVILTYWKLEDSIADSGFLKGLAARLICLCLHRGYRNAQRKCPEFDLKVRALLDELGELEKERSASIDRTADCFARLLSTVVIEMGQTDRALDQVLYHVGRWIYLIDAVDDLAEDQNTGNYNPVATRFPAWSKEDRAYLQRNLEHSLSLAGAAFQLLKRNAWSSVIENIL